MLRTLLNREKQQAIRVALASLGEVQGALAELGVYRGGITRLLSTTCPNRTVHAFDTFSGLPRTNGDIDWHCSGEFAEPVGMVKAYLADCPNVQFHVGHFPETTAGLGDERFAFVHLDADLYQSTLSGLVWFWPRLVSGGAIVLDDWKWKCCEGVDRAVQEFFSRHRGYELVETARYQLTATKL